MLSFGQHTEGAHNVMFCMLQQPKPQVCGGGEKDSEGHVCHTKGTMTDPVVPPFPAQSNPSHTYWGP